MDFNTIFFGDRTSFGIELIVKRKESVRWIYGSFFFWVNGVRIGDPLDSSDLRGCVNWLGEMSANQSSRNSKEYYELKKELLFFLYSTDYIRFPSQDLNKVQSEKLGEFSKAGFCGKCISLFEIDHVGMSSFERFGILLIENKKLQRCVWRELNGPIYDAVFPSGTIERASDRVVRMFEERFGEGFAK